MPTRRVTFLPIDPVDKLSEYEKILSHQGYAQWRLEKIIQEVDIEEMTKGEKVWLSLLNMIQNDEDTATEYIFIDLKRDVVKFSSKQKEFISFFIRLIQKQPKCIDRVIALFGKP